MKMCSRNFGFFPIDMWQSFELSRALQCIAHLIIIMIAAIECNANALTRSSKIIENKWNLSFGSPCSDGIILHASHQCSINFNCFWQKSHKTTNKMYWYAQRAQALTRTPDADETIAVNIRNRKSALNTFLFYEMFRVSRRLWKLKERK